MTRLMDRFIATAGSVIGREHVRLHKNNQDGVAIAADGDAIVAAVADGCSSSKYSEVGARLAAAWLARSTLMYAQGATPAERADALGQGLLDFVGSVCFQMSPGGMAIDDLLHHYFLFTYLVVLMTPDSTWISGQGDGVFAVNGRVTVLDSGPENAPRYLAYRLADPARLRGGTAAMSGRPATLFYGATADVKSVVIGTDGVSDLIDGADTPLSDGEPQGGLEQFLEDPRYVTNPSLVHKRLIVIGDAHGRLRDDTSLVVIRRKEDLW